MEVDVNIGVGLKLPHKRLYVMGAKMCQASPQVSCED